MKVDRQPAIVNDLAVDTVESLRPAAKDKDVSLDAAMCPEPILVDADVARMQQVFVNIVSNAVKFTPARGRVRVVLDATSEQAVFTVEDNGSGISREFLPHVFDRFSQADADGRHCSGLGLGLAVSRAICELHDATITAQSDGEGKGATFQVRMPRHTFER